MINYEIVLSDEFAEQAELFNRYDEISERHLRDALDGSLRGIQGLTRINMPVGVSGNARNSIDVEVKSLGGNVEGRVFSNIRSPYPYPLVIEFGRKPGRMPPPSALRLWVRRVINPPDRLINGVAYLVARAIGRKGIKGRYPLKKAVESSRVRVGMFFREALDRIAKEMEV